MSRSKVPEMDNMNTKLLDYINTIPLLTDGLRQLEILLQRMLRSAGLCICKMEFTLKDGPSVMARLANSQEAIKGIEDLPGLIEVRIIAHYASEIPKILGLLSQFFQVIARNHPRETITQDPFVPGYPMEHLVVRMPKDRLELVEYEAWRKFKIDLQVCSLAQYVWMHLEHQIGYSEENFPKEKTRAYSQLAYILESFDNELDKLRDFLSPSVWPKKETEIQYHQPDTNPDAEKSAGVKNVRKQTEEAMDENDNDGPDKPSPGIIFDIEGLKLTKELQDLTLKSLERFILDNELVRRMDGMLAARYDTRLMYSQAAVDKLFEALSHTPELKQVADLETSLFEMRDNVINAAVDLYDNGNGGTHETIQKGSVLCILVTLLMARKGDKVRLRSFIEAYSFGANLMNKSHVRIFMRHSEGRIKRSPDAQG
ncbi:MAG TPA: hypothetical protein DCS88_05135 [Alphaproteobacteria bacterium]|nr:hypothetical protein [Alphaproteobacteria bacterium]